MMHAKAWPVWIKKKMSFVLQQVHIYFLHVSMLVPVE
jgi:hypothetical protein